MANDPTTMFEKNRSFNTGDYTTLALKTELVIKKTMHVEQHWNMRN